MEKILITAPVPPPIHGMSLATAMLIEGLPSDFQSVVIDTAMEKKKIALKQPSLFSPKRFFKSIYRLLRDGYIMFTTKYSVNYMCCGADFRGVIRYLPYAVISRIKGRPYVIHVHNGAFGAMYKSLHGVKKYLINYMFGGAAGVIALGESLRKMFSGVVKEDRLFVVENCANDEFFLTPEQIKQKKNNCDKKLYKILYLSNLMQDKGVFELMRAVVDIPDCELHLAGAIEQRRETKEFVEMMLAKHGDKMKYHGVVAGEEKKSLLKECDIFVLPSRYKVEGQPISILEAYASGMAVVTDPRTGGVSDIFEDNVNGYACLSDDEETIKSSIEKCMATPSIFIENNYKYAVSKFTKRDFVGRVVNVFRSVV